MSNPWLNAGFSDCLVSKEAPGACGEEHNATCVDPSHHKSKFHFHSSNSGNRSLPLMVDSSYLEMNLELCDLYKLQMFYKAKRHKKQALVAFSVLLLI